MNVESKPGETTKLEKMQLFGGSSEKKENIRPIINKIINQTGDIFIETISKQRKNLVIFLLPLSLIMLILIFYYIHHKKLKQKKIPEEYRNKIPRQKLSMVIDRKNGNLETIEFFSKEGQLLLKRLCLKRQDQ